jgi:hypothetical protein
MLETGQRQKPDHAKETHQRTSVDHDFGTSGAYGFQPVFVKDSLVSLKLRLADRLP